MATLIQIRDKANAKLADIWPIIQAKQDTYFTKHGTYFGLNWSPSLSVVDGVDSDLVINRPSRFHVAGDAVFNTDLVPFQIQIIRHDGATQGYTATVRIELLNGDVYVRSRSNTDEDTGWSKLEVIPT